MKVIRALVEYQIKIDEWSHEDPEYETPEDYMQIVREALMDTDPMDYQNTFYDAISEVKVLSIEEIDPSLYYLNIVA